MNIIFAPRAFDYSYLVADSRRIDIGDETFNPLSGVSDFHTLFEEIDGKKCITSLAISKTRIKFAFWSRDEFIESLRAICTDDVYIQSSDWSMEMSFVNPGDLTAFDARLNTRKGGATFQVSNALEGFVRQYISDMGVERHEYEMTRDGIDACYFFREKEVADLAVIKFAKTTLEDHLRPPPEIPENA